MRLLSLLLLPLCLASCPGYNVGITVGYGAANVGVKVWAGKEPEPPKVYIPNTILGQPINSGK